MSLEIGVCLCAKSFLVTEAERKYVRWRARFQQQGDASRHQVSFPARQGTEGNSPSKTGWPSLNVIFPPIMCLVLDDPKQWPPREIIDQINELILEDHQISPKSIAEQLGISRGHVGSIIQEDLDMQKLSTKWVPRHLNADQKRRCQSSEKFWNFFGAIQMTSCRDWWPWAKPDYITMTRRQSNNQWSDGIAAHHPAPKNSECKNPVEKFSPRFFGIKTASSTLIIFQRAKLSTRSITHLCWCNWRTFEGKTPQEGHQWGLVLARQCPG